jgi:hypothetical protein
VDDEPRMPWACALAGGSPMLLRKGAALEPPGSAPRGSGGQPGGAQAAAAGTYQALFEPAEEAGRVITFPDFEWGVP